MATHIPILAKGSPEEFILYGHVANSNPMLHHLRRKKPVLLIFHGVHGYISSSWYRQKDISTWDYAAVHINGHVHLQNKEELQASLSKLVYAP